MTAVLVCFFAALFVALVFARLANNRRRDEEKAWNEYLRIMREDA